MILARFTAPSRRTATGYRPITRKLGKEVPMAGLQQGGEVRADLSQREIAAKLIRYHGLPVWFWTKDRIECDLLKAAESIPFEASVSALQGRCAGTDCKGSLPVGRTGGIICGLCKGVGHLGTAVYVCQLLYQI